MAALLSVVALSSAARTRTRRLKAGAGTSIAAAVVAFVAPRDGADTVVGDQLCADKWGASCSARA
jgi:hypothetical protein